MRRIVKERVKVVERESASSWRVTARLVGKAWHDPIVLAPHIPSREEAIRRLDLIRRNEL